MFSSFASDEEYILKAGFIEKIAEFITWPSKSEIEDISKPFVIKVIGGEPFDNILTERYKNNKIKKKEVKIYYIDKINEIKESNILFVTKSVKIEPSEILSFTRDKPILTIGETKNFAKKGGHINFYFTENNTLAFEINESKIRESGLKVDLLLLEVAKIIR
ncbi:MAG: YfiR family protein [Desulfobacterales bacterium]|nr:YfiR family protein [Desulfobacterales bacterium]